MTITAIVCAYNEARHLPACLFSLLAQTRPPDEVLVINNASTDDTGTVPREIARGIANVRVIDEPAKRLVVARETARRAARGSVLAYVDTDCRAPLRWLERVDARLARARSAVAVTGPYKFYDWDCLGRALIAAYDVVVAPPTHVMVHHAFGIGAILYGGNFAVRADALSASAASIAPSSSTAKTRTWDGASRKSDACACVPIAGCGRRPAGITRWGSARCFRSTCGISGPRSCGTARPTARIST